MRVPWRDALGVMRDAWIAIGLAALLFLAIEATYRTGGAVMARFRRTSPLAAAVPSLHPYADSAWFPQFDRDRRRIVQRWEPFCLLP